MADERDFIEEMQDEARLRFGRDLSPVEAAIEFARHPLDGRVQHLKNLKSDDALSVRDAAKRLSYTRALHQTHERLRKVDR
jgi:hypothetical protein